MDKNSLIKECIDAFIEDSKREAFSYTEEQVSAVAEDFISQIPSLLKSALKYRNHEVKISTSSVYIYSQTITSYGINVDHSQTLANMSILAAATKLKELDIECDLEISFSGSPMIFIRVEHLKKFCKYNSVRPLV